MGRSAGCSGVGMFDLGRGSVKENRLDIEQTKLMIRTPKEIL
jgi:hypothetical protein